MLAIHVWELSPRPRPFRKNYVDNNQRVSEQQVRGVWDPLRSARTSAVDYKTADH